MQWQKLTSKQENNTSSCRGIDIVAIFQWSVGAHGVAEDEDQDSRNNVSPRDFPVSTQLDAEHEFNVADKPVESVNPADANRFDSGHQENDETATKVIDNVQHDQSTLQWHIKVIIHFSYIFIE